MHNQTLPFPAGKPDEYILLRDEPVFDAGRHLQLEKPASSTLLADLGYGDEDADRCPSPVGITAPFRVFSDEGLAVMQDLAMRMKSNRNAAAGTGANRLGSYIRGAGYRSQFVRDFCECPEWLDFVSDIAKTRLGRHTVPAVACGINYAPEDVTRAIDTWHVDSVSYDAVILLTPPDSFRGGEFQYFLGTKEEGEHLLGGAGEEGAKGELPADRIRTMKFPAAGCGFLQQGNMVFHRACRLLEPGERTTLLPSFAVLESGQDATNVSAMSKWGDPGLLAELARHEAWRAAAPLRRLIDGLPLSAPPEEIAAAAEAAAEEAAGGLRRFAAEARAASK